MLWDTHVHTSFSGDSDAAAELMVSQASLSGLSGVCITDHLDYDYPADPDLFLLDLPAYEAEVTRLGLACQDRFPVLFGLELGLSPHLAGRHRALLAAMDFDFVIGSSHVVHGSDPYYPSYYEGRSIRAAYREYFESIAENILAFDGFDVYGHLDYVMRYGSKYDAGGAAVGARGMAACGGTHGAACDYETYADIIDHILRLLIERGKGLELNTAGFRHTLHRPNPSEEILKRYRELGGEIVTTGSDAHRPADLAFCFDRVPEILSRCGFRYVTIFKKRRPIFIPL